MIDGREKGRRNEEVKSTKQNMKKEMKQERRNENL
jgi:hypothetical protein